MRDAKDDIPLLHNFHYDRCNFWWSMQPPSTMHTLPTTKKKQTFSRSEKWKRGNISCWLFRWENGASVKFLLPAGLNDVLEMSEWTFVVLLAWQMIFWTKKVFGFVCAFAYEENREVLCMLTSAQHKDDENGFWISECIRIGGKN